MRPPRGGPAVLLVDDVAFAQDAGGDAQAEDDEHQQGGDELVFRLHGVGLLRGVFSSSEANMSIMVLVSALSASKSDCVSESGSRFSRSRAADCAQSRGPGG